MPSTPHSAHVVSARDARSMNSEVVVAPSSLSNQRTKPSCSTTNQRLESPGTCCREMGWFANLRSRFGNTRCVPRVALLVARSGATQVVLLGRASSPLRFCGAGGGGFGDGVGDGLAGGGCRPPSPPEQ